MYNQMLRLLRFYFVSLSIILILRSIIYISFRVFDIGDLLAEILAAAFYLTDLALVIIITLSIAKSLESFKEHRVRERANL